MQNSSDNKSSRLIRPETAGPMLSATVTRNKYAQPRVQHWIGVPLPTIDLATRTRAKFATSLLQMGDSATFPDEDLLLTFGHDSRWDCDGCPPPSFNLPPPPRPPWLEDVEDCDETSPGIALDQLESCSNHILVDPFGGGGSFEDTFHSVAVIVVCALVLIIVLMIAGVVLFR